MNEIRMSVRYNIHDINLEITIISINANYQMNINERRRGEEASQRISRLHSRPKCQRDSGRGVNTFIRYFPLIDLFVHTAQWF